MSGMEARERPADHRARIWPRMISLHERDKEADAEAEKAVCTIYTEATALPEPSAATYMAHIICHE